MAAPDDIHQRRRTSCFYVANGFQSDTKVQGWAVAQNVGIFPEINGLYFLSDMGCLLIFYLILCYFLL